jgi:hypothetical protein
VVLVDDEAHGEVSLKPCFVALQTISRDASLVELKLAEPEVHVEYKLASEAEQFRRELRYAHGLNVLHVSRLEKHSWFA